MIFRHLRKVLIKHQLAFNTFHWFPNEAILLTWTIFIGLLLIDRTIDDCRLGSSGCGSGKSSFLDRNSTAGTILRQNEIVVHHGADVRLMRLLNDPSALALMTTKVMVLAVNLRLEVESAQRVRLVLVQLMLQVHQR